MPFKRPRATIVACVLLVACFLAGAARLSINADTRVFFSDHNENRLALDAFEARYSKRTGLLMVYRAREGDLFTDARLAAISDLTEASWRLPFATRVDSYANAVRISSDNEGLIIGEMADIAETESPAAMKAEATNDSLLVDRLISPDGRTGAIAVTVDYPMASSSATGEILAAARALNAGAALDVLGLEVWYGGRVASSNAFSSAAKNDLKTLTPLSWVVIFLFVLILTRSPLMTGALLATATLAIGAAMGAIGWAGIQINAATSSGPTIILCVTVASLMHLLTAVQETLRDGLPRRPAVETAYRDNLRPIALALGTTIVGFLSLNWADAPPFREVGNLAACGVFFALLLGLTFLPAMLVLMPLRPARRSAFIDRLVAVAANVAIDRRRTILVAAVPVTAIILAGIGRIEVDDNLIGFFDESYEYRRHADLIQENLTGLDVIEFDFGSDVAGSVTQPDYFRKLQRFEEWLRAQPKVDHVQSLAETYRRLNQHLNGGDEAFHVVPEDGDTLAQYLLLYEMSLPFGRSLTDAVDIERSRSRVTAIMRGATTRDVRALREEAEAWLQSEAPLTLAGPATGLAVMYAYLTSLNVEFMVTGTIAALLAISAILIFALQSVKYGAISLIPNLLPVALAFGAWGYLAGSVGVAVAAVGASTLGIIVDDTVHLMWRYRQQRALGVDAQTAVRRMLQVVGPPMLISSLTLLIGYGVVASSHFHISASLGALSAITIAFALVADWFLLPPVLMLIDKKVRAATREAQQPFHRAGATSDHDAEQAEPVRERA